MTARSDARLAASCRLDRIVTRLLTLVFVPLLVCCGEAAPAATPPATSAPTAAAPALPPPSAPPVAVAAPPAEPPRGEPVDLLRATSTEIAVSSAYRDDPGQAAKLVDGDLETAWNSRTGDLEGAWIDVSLPEGATVTSIELTAGFTHRSATADLFEGNHRVSRVRVLREGVEVGAFDVDPTSRALQSIPVHGAGGLYRIEIAAVVAGSRAEWREACISELRVMGHAPGASAGTTTPRVAVGALPTAEPAPADATALPPVSGALPSMPAPPALATLASTLTAAGVERLFRVDDVFAAVRDESELRVSAIAVVDASGTWLCANREGRATRCVIISTSSVSIHQPHGTLGEVAVSYLDDERFWIAVELPESGPPIASRRAEHAPASEMTPLPAPAMREPPAWLAALDGLEIVSGYRSLAAADDGWLTICSTEHGITCLPAAPIEPLRRERLALSETTQMFGETHSVGFEWWARDGERQESGQGSVFVRAEDALVLQATVINALDRRAPAAHGRGAFDVVEMECFDADMISESCLRSGPPTAVRRREDADGDEHPLGSITFQRAPDTLPATGIADPLAVSLEGAWNMLPNGGLRRRSRPCPEE